MRGWRMTPAEHAERAAAVVKFEAMFCDGRGCTGDCGRIGHGDVVDLADGDSAKIVTVENGTVWWRRVGDPLLAPYQCSWMLDAVHRFAGASAPVADCALDRCAGHAGEPA